jgi:hypothetical protein
MSQGQATRIAWQIVDSNGSNPSQRCSEHRLQVMQQCRCVSSVHWISIVSSVALSRYSYWLFGIRCVASVTKHVSRKCLLVSDPCRCLFWESCAIMRYTVTIGGMNEQVQWVEALPNHGCIMTIRRTGSARSSNCAYNAIAVRNPLYQMYPDVLCDVYNMTSAKRGDV